MASSSCASPSNFQRHSYEVFLSFRGEDTRQNFTSHLHAALVQRSICTFIDDGLCRGEEITTSLLEVIEGSKIAVIVFSKDYASSHFCLDEVAKIMECHETHGQIVVPIFYHVDPSDVENQTGSFETAFANHSKTCSFDRVERWKSALNKAASMAGWDSKVIRPDSKLVENIAKDIPEKFNEEFSSDLEGLVGMHSRIQEIRELLSAESQDVRFLGIWGMGGIGKTM